MAAPARVSQQQLAPDHQPEQRFHIERHMRDNPGLKSHLAEAMTDAFSLARIKAERETGLRVQNFPDTCPFSFDEGMSNSFWPE